MQMVVNITLLFAEIIVRDNCFESSQIINPINRGVRNLKGKKLTWTMQLSLRYAPQFLMLQAACQPKKKEFMKYIQEFTNISEYNT